MKCGLYNVVATLIIGTLTLASCYSVMPINSAKTSKDSKSTSKTVIAYYDPTIGTDAIETFIKKNNIEVLYRYSNIKGYALKLQNDKQRKDWRKHRSFVRHESVASQDDIKFEQKRISIIDSKDS